MLKNDRTMLGVAPSLTCALDRAYTRGDHRLKLVT